LENTTLLDRLAGLLVFLGFNGLLKAFLRFNRVFGSILEPFALIAFNPFATLPLFSRAKNLLLANPVNLGKTQRLLNIFRFLE